MDDCIPVILGSTERFKAIQAERTGTFYLNKNYTHFTLIDNGCYELDKYRLHVHEACEKYDKIYSEEEEDLKFVEAILNRRCEMVTVLPNSQNDESKETYQSRKAFFPET